MNINEFKYEKEKLEEEISRLINEFQDKTSCYVSDIDLIQTEFARINGTVMAKTQVVIQIKF